MVIEWMRVALRRIFDPNPKIGEDFPFPEYDEWEIDYSQCCEDAEDYRKYLEEELGKAVSNKNISTDYVRSLNGELNKLTMMWKEFFTNAV